MDGNKPNWLKSKGYLHISPQINVDKKISELTQKVKNKAFISKYAFYPLIHISINERRYKRIAHSAKHAHSFTDENGQHKRNIKSRPLHYATHLDAIIFGYYAELLQNQYEIEINKYLGLHDCIIAYRKISIVTEKINKSTIHFAHEVFQEIRKRSSEQTGCAVLAFDIKSFFSSLDHTLLKKAWADLFQFSRLPNDHFNVFKGATSFSYILWNDLRTNSNKNSHSFGFDEQEFARIRNTYGFNALFESSKVFREKVKSGELKIYKFPFRNKYREPIGIPQGLPISAILANLYLLEFDLKILDEIVNKMNCYYRRYSDDIAIICSIEQMNEVEAIITKFIEESKLVISKDKTERFIYRKTVIEKKEPILTSVKLSGNGDKIGAPFVYLGFEFNGKNALIKSANLSKFYRRMISSVKRKAKRAIKKAKANGDCKPVIFKRQLFKLYTSKSLSKNKVHNRWKRLIKNELGTFTMKTGKKSKLQRSNYFTYVKRASFIMNEPAIEKQMKKHKHIFNEAIHRHLTLKNKMLTQNI